MMEPQDEEYSLALRARGGDPDAVAELVARARLRLFAQAHQELGHYDDAQDAVAAALLQICLHVGALRDPAHVVAWMQSIVRHEARKLRRGQASVPLHGEEPASRPDDIPTLLLRLDIEQALQRLPGQQAQALRFFHMDGLSVREIADTLGASGRTVGEATIKVWLHRGRRHLAAEMKGYRPMTKEQAPVAPSLRSAAILHTDLTPEQLQTVSDALRSGGFAPEVLAPSGLPDFRADQRPLREVLQDYEALVVDERIGGRSGLEYVLFCKAYAETAGIPITLLHSQPENMLLVTACYTAGIAHLARKDDPHSLATAFQRRAEPSPGDWASFTERARQVVIEAQKEAIGLGENCVSTEHLLLGLLREADSAGARLLAEKFRVPPARIVEEVGRHRTHGPGRSEGLPLLLTPRSKAVLDYAQAEARALGQRDVGSEHLLLGLIREESGSASRILADLGVTLAPARDAVAKWQAEKHH